MSPRPDDIPDPEPTTAEQEAAWEGMRALFPPGDGHEVDRLIAERRAAAEEETA